MAYKSGSSAKEVFSYLHSAHLCAYRTEHTKRRFSA